MTDLDLERNSRVILAVGADALARMQNFKVAIIGLSPTGSEVVKNLVLTSVGRIEICDSQITSNYDLGSNFFVRPKDVGRPRIDVLVPRFSKINHRSKVSGITGPYSDEWILSFDSVIIADLMPFSEVIRISDLCHNNHKQFILAITIGPCSVLFEDFGDFTCKNSDGLPPQEATLTRITRAAQPLISLSPADIDIRFRLNSTIRFLDIPGLPALNGLTATVTKAAPVAEEGVVPAFRVDLDTRSLPPFDKTAGHGRIVEVKREPHFSHQPLSEKLTVHLTNGCDYSSVDFDSIRDLIVAAIKFWDETGHRPRLLDEADAAAIAAKLDRLDPTIAQKIALCAGVEYPPNSGIIGGAAAQEALKFCSFIFEPSVEQWLVIDNSPVIAWTSRPVLVGDRYDSLNVILGNEVSARLREVSALVLGVGAIGCEFARYAALFGFGKIALVDHDRIEPSNLTRQFLFRDKHRGLSKAAVAKSAILKANPSLKSVSSLEGKFEGATVKLFSQGFDIALSAVDSVPARRFIAEYADHRSIPMVNAGMLKTRANWEVIIPRLTVRFSMTDPEEKQFFPCTLKVNPVKPADVIQWSHNEFIRLFAHHPHETIRVREDF
jgi:ubiquitin-activating enzyme E1